MWIEIPQHSEGNNNLFPYRLHNNSRFSIYSTYNLRPRTAWVTWRPPQARLHYPELYAGIYEYLRVAPHSGRGQEARVYLASLLLNTPLLHSPAGSLQRDRIEWVRAWLRELEGVKMLNAG
jgi:hypothetical protein